ncbi:YraN family protein [Niveispirillum sp. KHB5.9]|uniref:YraN family protein n=1 Tax=Niveispirillum sp. KHB5.9 TaxID=3400269 RepID=UPI003A84E3D8
MTRRERIDRRRAERLGRIAEWLCCLVLWLKGYRVLATRLRLPVGEVDIIATKRGVVAVVEVKARRNMVLALSSLPRVSWRRRYAAISQFVAQRPHLAHHAIRFDLMAVLPRRLPRHVKDVWRMEGP